MCSKAGLSRCSKSTGGIADTLHFASKLMQKAQTGFYKQRQRPLFAKSGPYFQLVHFLSLPGLLQSETGACLLPS